MQTKDDIFQELKKILTELFEIDEDMVTLDVKLYDELELDLDSIDAIDMIVKLQQITGKKVKPEDFKSVRTIQDVIDVVYKMIHEQD